MNIKNKKSCAYCAQPKKLTREHVIPSWYINLDRSPDDLAFSERAPKKFVSEMVVRDVCEDCNNIPLSSLDAYGRTLYEEYFHDFVFKDECIDFNYDYQKLLKWLIKCSYNSARVHNADLEVLKDYTDYLINNEQLPSDIIVFCATVAPSNTTVFDNPIIATRGREDDLYEPHWFRLGVFRVPDFDTIDYCFRSVTINSYTFFIALPKLKSDYIKQKRTLLRILGNSDLFGERITSSGFVKLSPPVMGALESFQHQIGNNPLTYEIAKDALSDHIKEENPEKIVYLIPREDIEEGNIDELEAFFLYLTFSREIALLYMQKVEFAIDGYNDDPRELYEIKEVVNYLGKLNKVFPYWLFYQLPQGKWLDVLMACLSKGNIEYTEERKNFVAMDTKLIVRHMDRWFVSLNELSHRLSISERLNRKISEDFNARIKRFIPLDDKN